MKVVFSRPTRSSEDQQLLFSQFGAAGFDGLQLKRNQFEPYLGDPGRFLEDWGAYPGCASGLIVFSPLDEETIAKLRATFKFAEVVGTETIVYCQVTSRSGLSNDDIAGFARTLSELGREAKDAGVKFSLHHHYDHPVMYREDFDVFFDAVDDGTVGLTVDTAHLVKSGINDIDGLIRDFREIIDNVHLKDFADGKFRILGQGEIDFGPVFAALNDIGYDQWLCADEESGGDLAEGLHTSYQFVTEGLSNSKKTEGFVH